MSSFDKIGVNYKVVVEPQEYDSYAEYFPKSKLLALPHTDKGLVVTRNWIWDYAQQKGFKKFWTFDDNIESFWRFNNNSKVKIKTASFLKAIEDFGDRYANAPVIGMNYYMFVRSRYNTGYQSAPFQVNTRVYSNMLIETEAKTPYGKPYRNEGFFNDDTDLCLRILKDRNCTILFNAFLIKKRVTMSQTGGMTPYYLDDGRYKMALELKQKHPDVTKITKKWGRWQHHVDYKPFKKNRLIKKEGVVIPQGVNNYGMKLVRKSSDN